MTSGARGWRRCGLGVGLALGGLIAIPARAQTVEDVQLWTNITVTGSINDKFVYVAQVQPRWFDNATRLAQILLVAPSLGYRVSKDVTVFAGYAYGYADSPRGPGTSLREHRAYQQINVTVFQKGRDRITNFSRLEERIRTSGPGIGWRIRTNFTYARQLGPTPRSISAVAYVEPLLNLNDTVWGARKGIDQLRGFAGMRIPVSKQASVETGYLAQFVNGRGPNNQLNHVAVLGLSIRI